MSWIDFIAIAAKFLKGVGWVSLPLLALPLIWLVWTNNRHLDSFSDHIIKIVDQAISALGEMTKWLLPLLVFVVALSVFADVVFGLAWTKLYESSIYIHAASILLGSGAALLANQHVRVDIFYTRFTPQKKALTDLCGFYMLLMPVCLIVLWNAQGFVSRSWSNFEGFAETDSFVALHYLKTGVPIFCLTMLAQGLAISLRAVAVLRNMPEPETPKNIAPLFPAQGEHHDR